MNREYTFIPPGHHVSDCKAILTMVKDGERRKEGI